MPACIAKHLPIKRNKTATYIALIVPEGRSKPRASPHWGGSMLGAGKRRAHASLLSLRRTRNKRTGREECIANKGLQLLKKNKLAH